MAKKVSTMAAVATEELPLSSGERILHEIVLLRKEIEGVRKDVEGVETRLGKEIEGVRKDVEGVETRLNGRMDKLDGQLNGRMDKLEGQLGGEIRALRGEFIGLRYWALLVAGLCVAIFVKSFIVG